MEIKNRACLAFVLAGIGSLAFADNPLVSYHYLADPAAFVMDSTFYILADTDDESGDDGYTIKSYYMFGSKDMQNWTDYGMIFTAGREVSYASGAWAPGAVAKDGRIYIVYPNGASGIGMLTASNPAGPFTDPVGKLLIGGWGSSAGSVDCDGIAWCFDPAIFVDDDDQVYITYGGGNSDTRAYGNNFDLYKLNGLSETGISLNASSKVQIQGATNSFEASYIHKYNGKYYLTYNDRSQHISYAISSSVGGPYTYMGTFMENPNINGTNINAYNNNHHGIAEFNGHWYVAYHDRRLAQASEHPASLGVANPEPAYHRSLSIDEFTYSGEKMNSLTFTNEGPKQLRNFDPFEKYPALTSSKQRNVRSRSDYTAGKPISHVLTPYASKESWIRVSGVDFGGGARSFVVNAASVASGNKIEVRTGSASGTLAGTCELPQTSGWNSYEETECDMDGLTGVVDYLFIVFKGAADSTMGILEWEFTQGDPEPQKPVASCSAGACTEGVAHAIPGKIEMENFDIPGVGKGNDSYYDKDSENHGDSDYRDGTGVDLYAKATGVVVGYNQAGEWLEYTVNVKESGIYTMFAAVASANETSGFVLSMDGIDITDTVSVPKNEGDDNWDDYNKVSVKVDLTAGEHILRFTVAGDWMDIDYVTFVEGENADDPEPIGDDAGTTKIANNMNFRNYANNVHQVYSLSGKFMGNVDLNGISASDALSNAGLPRGVYMLRYGAKKFMATVK